MKRYWIGEPNPPAAARPSGGGKASSNRSKRRKTKMKRRTRDRRGRFKPGQARKARGRSRARRGGSRKTRSRKRRSAPRSSNPPETRRRKRRSSARRSKGGKVRYRTRTVVKRGRRSNPPYTIKTVLMGLAVTGAGFAGTKIGAWAIVKIAKKPEWNLGWKPVLLHGVSAVLVAGIGYGIARLITNKRTALHVGGELLVGGVIATAAEGYVVWKIQHPAPAPNPQLGAGAAPRGFSPQQFENAQRASQLLGLGGFSPQQFAAAGGVARDFGKENF